MIRKILPRDDTLHGMTKSPNLVSTLHWIDDVSLVRRLDAVKANAVVPAAHERNIFGVRPAKRHRRAGRTTAFHSCMRQVGSVPNLFGDHAALVRKIFHRRDERFWIATGSEFVMAAFSCQNRPATAYACSVEALPSSFCP